jgi:hypothetical protein
MSVIDSTRLHFGSISASSSESQDECDYRSVDARTSLAHLFTSEEGHDRPVELIGPREHRQVSGARQQQEAGSGDAAAEDPGTRSGQKGIVGAPGAEGRRPNLAQCFAEVPA